MNSKQKNSSKQNNKGLQKFTNLEDSVSVRFAHVKTVEDIRALTNEEAKDLGDWINDKLNDALKNKEKHTAGEVDKYWGKFEKYIEALKPDCMEETRRTRWQTNKHLIEREVHRFLMDEKRLPTQNELVYSTGLSRTTVTKHLKEGAGAIGYKEETETYKLMTQKVLAKLYRLGMEYDNTKAFKIFLDYLKEPQPTNIRQQNNYLQVNNTRIDELTLEELPQEAKIEIEEILKRYTNE